MKTSKEADFRAIKTSILALNFVDGHCQLGLPQKPGVPKLPENRQQTVTRLSCRI